MFLLLGLSFVTSTIVFGLIITIFLNKRASYKVRVKKFLPQEIFDEDNIQKKNKKKEKQINVFKGIGPYNNSKSKWTKKLELAGIQKTPEEFIAIRILIGLILLAIFFLLGVRGTLLYLSLPIGFLVPSLYVKRKIEKRLAIFSEQLAEALGIIANGMRAGFSFMQAMKMVASEMADPLGAEFTRTLSELNLGVSFEEGFTSLLERIPSKELELVVNALLIQRTTGGNLSELLETMQETIRGRVRLKEELNTLTAQGKMSSWIITLLPPFIAIYLNFMNPEYFQPMFKEPLGWLMIGFSVFFILIGWIIIRKIVRIEV